MSSDEKVDVTMKMNGDRFLQASWKKYSKLTCICQPTFEKYCNKCFKSKLFFLATESGSDDSSRNEPPAVYSEEV